MREPHLNLLALASRLLEGFSIRKGTRNVSGAFVDVARNLARWFLRTALRFERAYIAVELAGAIQKRLALMHGTTCAKLLPTRAEVNVACRIISKVATRESAVVRFDLSNTGIWGAMPFSSTNQFSIGAAP